MHTLLTVDIELITAGKVSKSDIDRTCYTHYTCDVYGTTRSASCLVK